MKVPSVHWAETADGDNIAYQVFGRGPVTLVLVTGWLSHLEVFWEQRPYADFLWRLASFARVIHFDRRGTGMSDRFSALPTLDARLEDVRAVMDATGTDRAALLGLMDGAALAALFAATHPERTLCLLFSGYARTTWAPDYPFGEKEDEVAERRMHDIWGLEEHAREYVQLLYGDLPVPEDPGFALLHAKQARYSATPKSMMAFNELWRDTDVRGVLPSIRVPALVLAPSVDTTPSGDTLADEAAYIAERTPGAKVAFYQGHYAVMWLGDSAHLTGLIERFLASVSEEEAVLDRKLATVLFTDVVDSTDRACELGDRAWTELLERHHQVVRAMLARYRGNEIDTAGDGFLATFDGPARAVKCAQAICEAVRPLGLEVRAGCHTGEIELLGEGADGAASADIGGIAVHIGARVAALAGPSEVLVSSTVKDLVAGSGLVFEERGEHVLRGVPEKWRLYVVAA